MPDSMVGVDRLTKAYGRITALADVSLSIRPGEVLGLIGPNGAGKSTLFECLAGVLPSDSGTMRAGGHRVGASERRALLFYVPDAITPSPEQSVRWALDFPIGFLGGQPSLRDEVVKQLDLHP